MTRRLCALALATVVATVLAGCTGVPTSSTPQVVQAIGVEQQNTARPISPVRGAGARDIVTGFLDANAINPSDAHLFLTQQALSQWADTTVTVIADDPTVTNPDAHDLVTVTSTKIGSINADGQYSAVLQGDGSGSGGEPFTSTYGLQRVGGQWRINTLQSGLVITADEFANYYQQRQVYFLDAAQQHLVPELRYVDLTSESLLANWLVRQLAEGPASPQGTETSAMPNDDPSHIVLTMPGAAANSGVAKVDIPGASALSGAARHQLAAQLAQTLDQVGQIGSIQITDSGAPVSIPTNGTAPFTTSIAVPYQADDLAGPDFYYVNNGQIWNDDGTRLPGPVGAGVYGLTSVALKEGQKNTTYVAGTRTSGGMEYLDIGTSAKLIGAKVRGVQLSRPDWAPDTNEVWIGSGSTLYRVALNGSASAVPVSVGNGKLTGTIKAVRLSPEGSRVAMVIANSTGSQVYIGWIRRISGRVSVDGLTPISPQGVDLTDVAWNGPIKLFAVGKNVATHAAGVYEVQSDGSLWSARGIGSLPGPPDSITVAEGYNAVVSVVDTVWEQSAGNWVSLSGDETRGTNPIYAR